MRLQRSADRVGFSTHDDGEWTEPYVIRAPGLSTGSALVGLVASAAADEGLGLQGVARFEDVQVG